MRKQSEPAPGGASGSGLGLFSDTNSTPSSRRNQGTFVADRPPDLILGGQPFWRLGQVSYMGEADRLTGFVILTSLCATCARPFIVTAPSQAVEPYLNRRCEKHHRPGHRVRTFRPRWLVGRKGSQ